MTTNRFVSFQDGKAWFGLGKNAQFVLDLEKKRQTLRTNPNTSLYHEEKGFKWEPMSDFTEEGEPARFIIDDDDGDLCLVSSSVIDYGDEVTSQEALIDAGEADFLLDLSNLTYYHKGNGAFLPIT